MRRGIGGVVAGAVALAGGCDGSRDGGERVLHLSPSAIDMPVGSQRAVYARWTLDGDTFDAVDAAFSSSDPAVIRVETSDGSPAF